VHVVEEMARQQTLAAEAGETKAIF